MRSAVREEKVSNFESPAKAKLIARKNWLQTQCRCRFLCQGKSSNDPFHDFWSRVLNGNTCSWQRQLKRNEKLESLKSFCLSWNELSEVGKPGELKKNRSIETFQLQLYFPTSRRTFQPWPRLSNIIHSNFSFFSNSRFQLHESLCMLVILMCKILK